MTNVDTLERHDCSFEPHVTYPWRYAGGLVRTAASFVLLIR